MPKEEEPVFIKTSTDVTSVNTTAAATIENSAIELSPATTTALQENSKDIFRELYWYIIYDCGSSNNYKSNASTAAAPAAAAESPKEGVTQLRLKHIVASLEEEGLWFWRDKRFVHSQDVALRMAGQQKRVPFTGSITAESRGAAMKLPLDYKAFVEIVSPCARLFLMAFSEELVIPDWSTFTSDVAHHFHRVQEEFRGMGQNAQYIPILRSADPEKWAVSLCSTDGQRFSIGDSNFPHSLQSVSKPVTYALGLARDGEEFVNEWIGVEPAGRPFNTQDLDPVTNRPFNASINSGAIMAAGVYASGAEFDDHSWKEVVHKIRSTWYELCGEDLKVGLSEETFDSERETAYNNFAISYNLKGRRGLPRDVDLHKMLDVYLGCCSIEIQAEALAVAAATLANGGISPITAREVFPAHVVRSVLSETMMCGMYDQAGHFAVEVGLPAKSGVSGALMVIVPNVMGFATFSPRLNSNGNSVRGIEFCRRLVGSHRVHLFEPVWAGSKAAKIDPCRNGWKNERRQISRMAWAVEVGDVYACRLRDIFLLCVCQTAAASGRSLSNPFVLDAIRGVYKVAYQMPLDETLLQGVVEEVQQHPMDLRHLQKLTKDVHVVDSMRSLTLMSMVDIIFVLRRNKKEQGTDAEDEMESSLALHIAVTLGVDRQVALMEFRRYEQQVGHRYKHIEFCELMDAVDSDVVAVGGAGHHSLRSLRAHSLSSSAAEGGLKAAIRSLDKSDHGNEELLYLRREVIRLRKTVDKLKNGLHLGSIEETVRD